jgi:hypothetical protein
MRQGMIVLPDKIEKRIGNESFLYDDIGMSDSIVIIFVFQIFF